MKKLLSLVLCFAMLFSMVQFAYADDAIHIGYGSSGDDVFEIQNFLVQAGYLAGPADGNYGNNTKNAVYAFQKDNGLKATGIVDNETYELMFFSNIEDNGIYDSNGFTATPGDFVNAYIVAIDMFDDGNWSLDTISDFSETKVCDINWKGMKLSGTTTEIAALSFEGCENYEETVKQVAIVYDANHFFTNYTEWRENIIHMYAALPMAIDSSIETTDDAVALIEKIFTSATGGDIHNTSTNKLKQDQTIVKNNGVTYTLVQVDNSLYLYATVKTSPVIAKSTRFDYTVLEKFDGYDYDVFNKSWSYYSGYTKYYSDATVTIAIKLFGEDNGGNLEEADIYFRIKDRNGNNLYTVTDADFLIDNTIFRFHDLPGEGGTMAGTAFLYGEKGLKFIEALSTCSTVTVKLSLNDNSAITLELEQNKVATGLKMMCANIVKSGVWDYYIPSTFIAVLANGMGPDTD